MGCLAIGSNFIGAGRDHWLKMLESPRENVAQWYPLLESIPGVLEETSPVRPVSLSCLNGRSATRPPLVHDVLVLRPPHKGDPGHTRKPEHGQCRRGACSSTVYSVYWWSGRSSNFHYLQLRCYLPFFDRLHREWHNIQRNTMQNKKPNPLSSRLTFLIKSSG